MTDPAHRKSVGRPRRLTLDAVVDAACEIGVTRLEMSVLAERLNTGVATLYGYVRGREHLLELVSQRLAGTALIQDRGQAWQDIIREHSAVTFALFQSMPQLITNLIVGEADQQSARYAKIVLDMLTSRGLDSETAAWIYIEANQVVIGAAISLIRRNMIKSPLLDTDGRPITLPTVFGDYKPTLERIITDYEAYLSSVE